MEGIKTYKRFLHVCFSSCCDRQSHCNRCCNARRVPRARAWPHHVGGPRQWLLVITHYLSLWCLQLGNAWEDWSPFTDGRPLVGAAVITVNSDYTRTAALSVWWSIHTVWHRRLCISLYQWTAVSSDRRTSVGGSDLSADNRERSHQLANADQYCDGNHRLWRHR